MGNFFMKRKIEHLIQTKVMKSVDTLLENAYLVDSQDQQTRMLKQMLDFHPWDENQLNLMKI
jgi:hypothetical protein